MIVARSAFDGPSRQAFIDLSAVMSARGFAAPGPDAPARDALTLMHPTGVRILENRFGAVDDVAISASGPLGLWVERNDFAGAGNGTLAVRGPAMGVMVADNRIQGPDDSVAPLLQLGDVALACVFRNVFEPTGQVALTVTGGFGGLLVAGNTLMIDAGPEAAQAQAAIRLLPAGVSAFLSCTVMLNTIRGPFGSGIVRGRRAAQAVPVRQPPVRHGDMEHRKPGAAADGDLDEQLEPGEKPEPAAQRGPDRRGPHGAPGQLTPPSPRRTRAWGTAGGARGAAPAGALPLGLRPHPGIFMKR